MVDFLFILFGTILYFGFQHYSYQCSVKDGTVRYRTSHTVSTLIYTYMVLLFFYRIEGQLWRSSSLPFRLLYKVTSSLLALEILLNWVWRGIEYFMLVILQSAMNTLFEKIGIHLQVGAWPFTVLLCVISCYLHTLANNGDLYFEYYFNEEMNDDESDQIPLGTEDSGYGYPTFQNTRIRSLPSAPIRVSYRGNHTVATRPEIPLRRSTRLRSQLIRGNNSL